MISSLYFQVDYRKFITKIIVELKPINYILYFDLEGPRKNFYKTKKPKTEEELLNLLGHLKQVQQKITVDFITANTWRLGEDKKISDDLNITSVFLESDIIKQYISKEYITKLIQKYKNKLLQRNKKHKVRSNVKSEDPFKYQKYRYVKK